MHIRDNPHGGGGERALRLGGLRRARQRRPGQHPLLAGGVDHERRTCRTAPRTSRRRAWCSSRWRASTRTATWCPISPQEIPTLENGGVSEDLTTITWKLKDGLLWSDGTPVTAEDAVFTWQYCTHPEGGCAQSPNFGDVDQRRGGRPADDQGHLRRAEALSLRAVRRRAVADHPEGAVRRLPRRQRPDLHRGEHQADRHRAVRRHRLQGERRGAARGQPELPRPGEARLRQRGAEGRRRPGVGGALGARDRRVRLCLEPAGRARDPRADGWRPARAR